MVLKRTVKLKMPSLKRCRKDESLSPGDQHNGLLNPRKMQKHANNEAGVFGMSVEAAVTPRVLRSSRERVRPPLPRLVDSVPDNSRTSDMDSVKFNVTDDKDSVSVDPKLERHSKSFQLIYQRRKVRKESSCRGPESKVPGVDIAENEGLVDVYISYNSNINDFSRTGHNVISTSVVAEIEDSECLGKDCVHEQKKSNFLLEERNDYCKPPVFGVGDIVWAKSGSRDPAWPAIVINPSTDAPDAVLKCCIPNAVCVMYFGFSKNEKQRDYAWIKNRMIFPFLENKQRFEGQTQMFNCRPDDFHMAIKEALLAGNAPQDAKSGIFSLTCSRALEEAATSNPVKESQSQVLDFQEKHTSTCDVCGVTLPLAHFRRSNGSTSQHRPLCQPCSKLHKGKLQCGICQKTWNSSGGGSWQFESGMYQCPNCRSSFKSTSSPLVKGKQEAMMNGGAIKVRPERLPVVCNGIDGIYFPYLHLVQCKCGCCQTKEITLSEWERHTGCKAKKWKCSVKVKDTMSPLGRWLTAYDELGADPSKLRSEQIFSFLQGAYKAVTAMWTLEKCAVCRWVEDTDENKIIICNRCQIAVHQECYGARNIDITSWVCRVCETPNFRRECCLCPVRGGALKPTDIGTLWVHVTCAWFQPEVGFLDDGKMEPAIGILRIPPISFMKACVICKQTHGSCIRCCKCATHFHAVCAAQAGLYMELQCYEKNGIPVTQKMVYCAFHRAPNKDNSLVIHTPVGMFSATNVIQTQDMKHNIRGSRKYLTWKKELPEIPFSEIKEFESDSAARCRIYSKSNHKKARIEPVCHRPMGPRCHSIAETERLNSSRPGKLNTFASFKERLRHLQKTEKHRIGFGKSGIHGWGLFARQDIQEGEMIFEYRGELLRSKIADRKEAHYQVEGKDCYLFKISKDVVIDATNKGSMGRLINHSCMPNCFARIINVSQDESRIIIIGKKDIAAGDELTYDYMFDPYEQEDQRVPCLCKAPKCRKYMN